MHCPICDLAVSNQAPWGWQTWNVLTHDGGNQRLPKPKVGKAMDFDVQDGNTWVTRTQGAQILGKAEGVTALWRQSWLEAILKGEYPGVSSGDADPAGQSVLPRPELI